MCVFKTKLQGLKRWVCYDGKAWKSTENTEVRLSGLARESMFPTPSGDGVLETCGWYVRDVCTCAHVNSVWVCVCLCRKPKARHMARELYIRIDGAGWGDGEAVKLLASLVQTTSGWRETDERFPIIHHHLLPWKKTNSKEIRNSC